MLSMVKLCVEYLGLMDVVDIMIAAVGYPSMGIFLDSVSWGSCFGAWGGRVSHKGWDFLRAKKGWIGPLLWKWRSN